MIDTGRFKWINEPDKYEITEDRISITTKPHTDLWQRTYYHFRNDNAPCLQMETDEKFFSFVVRTDFTESHHRFDQCGVVLYMDSDNWLKGSVEYENENFQHLGSVVTNHGYSDWATTEIPAETKCMWYRLSRREDDFCIECSSDGITFSQMRVCHFWQGTDKIRFGIYACSPEDSSFTAVFTDLDITECKWRSHDGQQPDTPKKIRKLEDYITVIPDFPKKGVVFRDITSVIENVDGFRLSINELMDLLSDVEFDKLVALESRGFIFGAPIAYELQKPMVLVRKKGKLPRETISTDYGLEYGKSTIEIHKNSIEPGDRVVLLDDLIATGGTLEAAGRLVESLGGEVVKVAALVELRGFNARERLKYDISCVLSYDGK